MRCLCYPVGSVYVILNMYIVQTKGNF